MEIVLWRVTDDDASSQVPRSVRTDLQPAASVDLATGYWSVDVVSEGWWAPQITFLVAEAAASIDIPVRPAGVVTGRVVVEDKASPGLPHVTARFESADPAADPLAGETTCPIREGAFRCKVPASRLNLRIRAPRHVARYFWDVPIRTGETTTIGPVSLQRGASLTGSVALARPVRQRGGLAAIRVTATPMNVARANQGSLGLLGQTVQPEKNGFFHFDGLTPGEYVVRAASTDRTLLSEDVPVVVVEEALAELREPLLLGRPVPLRVLLTPNADPWGEPWLVSLERTGLVPGIVGKSAARPDGEWSSGPLRAGKYSLEIAASRGGVWFSDEVDIAGEPVSIAPSVFSTRITGRVTLGARPLESSLQFRSADGATAAFSSDAEGAYEGFLPHVKDEGWTVVVKSDQPHVEHVFTSVVPQQRPDSFEVRADLRVPATSFTGLVVDPAGTPQKAIVNVLSAERNLVQTHAGEDGQFELFGLSPGSYAIHAEAFLAESDIQQFELGDTVPAEPLRIVVKDQQRIEGRVFSAGGPVAGAEVRVYATDVPQQLVVRRLTDARGQFVAVVPGAARQIDVTVEAAGFDLRLLHTPIGNDVLQLKLEQRGGSLVLPAAEAGDLQPYLEHAGATRPLASILDGPFAHRLSVGGETRVAISPIEPGAYSVCMVTHSEREALRAGAIDRRERCTDGYLPPYGTVTLASPKITRRLVQ